MIVYSYHCNRCDINFDIDFLSLKEARDKRDKQRCPKCKKKAIRIISNISITFKGSGFYTTDSKNK